MWATDAIAGPLCTDSMLLISTGSRLRKVPQEPGITGLLKRELRFETSLA